MFLVTLTQFVFLINRFDFFGIYVVMFLEILRTLLQALSVFSLLIVAFGLSFFLLMRTEVYIVKLHILFLSLSAMVCDILDELNDRMFVLCNVQFETKLFILRCCKKNYDEYYTAIDYLMVLWPILFFHNNPVEMMSII